ncbi:MAG: hypothetical protein HQL86_03355, partial [Magnetococcales bacterium]|nr:hypothetical protein [Magnetococcales bacterium]
TSPAGALSPDWQAAGIALVLIFAYQNNLAKIYIPNFRYLLFWTAALIFLLVSLVRWFQASSKADADDFPDTSLTSSDLLVVCGLMLLAVGLIYFGHLHNKDDTYYLNLAIMTLDHPDRPLLSWDDLHAGAELLPIQLPLYRLQSLELLYAAVASWTGSSSVWVAHQVFPFFFVCLFVISQMGLLRLLSPRHWSLALLMLFFVALLIGGEIHEGFGGYTLYRIHLGKTVMLGVVMPFLLLQAIGFMRDPNPRRWTLLLLGNVAALGLSVTALFLGPFVTGIGLCAGWRPDRSHSRRLLIGLLATLYVIAVGLAIKQTIPVSVNAIIAMERSAHDSFRQVFGGESVAQWIYLWSLLAAWSLVPWRAVRLLMIALVFVYWLFPVNPFLYPLMTKYVTGTAIYWRVFWSLPVSALVAVGLTEGLVLLHRGQVSRGVTAMILVGLAALSALPGIASLVSSSLPLLFGLLIWLLFSASSMRKEVTSWVLATVLMFGFVFYAPFEYKRFSQLSPMIRSMEWRSSGVRIPQRELSVAVDIARLTPEGSSVLATEVLALWVPVLRGHPPLVAVRSHYIPTHLESARLSDLRDTLYNYVNDQIRPENLVDLLKEAMEAFHLGVIAIPVAHPDRARLERIIAPLGFLEKRVNQGYAIYRITSERQRDG